MKDSRHKYLDMSTNFKNRAQEIEMHCKVSGRICEALAVRLSRVKPKTQAEFENNEYWKEFILKTCQQNDKILEFMAYTKDLFTEILTDAESLAGAAKMTDIIKFQSETIEVLTASRDKIYEDIRRDKANS